MSALLKTRPYLPGNAYTDFHHTVFHIHSPTDNKDGTYMIPNVLDILYDVVGRCRLTPS
jgi:hypothetical protein